MRKELTWISTIIAFSILLVTVSTSFQFHSIDVQLHDAYFVLEPAHVIIFLSIVLIIGRYIFQLILFFVNRSAPFAIAVAMIMPVILYFIGAYVYLMLSIVSIVTDSYPEASIRQNTWIVYTPCLIFALSLIVIEIIAIRKIVRKNQ